MGAAKRPFPVAPAALALLPYLEQASATKELRKKEKSKAATSVQISSHPHPPKHRHPYREPIGACPTAPVSTGTSMTAWPLTITICQHQKTGGSKEMGINTFFSHRRDRDAIVSPPPVFPPSTYLASRGTRLVRRHATATATATATNQTGKGSRRGWRRSTLRRVVASAHHQH